MIVKNWQIFFHFQQHNKIKLDNKIAIFSDDF